jgi:adenosylcobinamide-phosphate synthase
VRAIGRLTCVLEGGLRRIAADRPVVERCAGVVLAAAVVGSTAASAWLVLALCDRVGPLASLLGNAALVYWGLAARSLGRETLRASDAPDLQTARRELSLIVGRDTAGLDPAEIYRACVETVAENYGDAVVAPLFWYVLGGPVALWAFKAVSTLDSMVGHKDERFCHLGWASARLDDLANLLPARLGWLLIALASLAAGEQAGAAFRVGWRDGRKHPSPNSGWCEAAMAGALGVRLGGRSTYRGVPNEKPYLGDAGAPITSTTVRRAIRVMWSASVLAASLAWAGRLRLIVLS